VDDVKERRREKRREVSGARTVKSIPILLLLLLLLLMVDLLMVDLLMVDLLTVDLIPSESGKATL
jgi:hypothetical protein